MVKTFSCICLLFPPSLSLSSLLPPSLPLLPSLPPSLSSPPSFPPSLPSSLSPVYKSLQEGASEEGRLQQREVEHLKRRADSAHQTAEEGLVPLRFKTEAAKVHILYSDCRVELSDSECSFSDLTSDSDAEFEANLPEVGILASFQGPFPSLLPLSLSWRVRNIV